MDAFMSGSLHGSFPAIRRALTLADYVSKLDSRCDAGKADEWN
jgi:hypothetical protein